jgi:hypothetical protein
MAAIRWRFKLGRSIPKMAFIVVGAIFSSCTCDRKIQSEAKSISGEFVATVTETRCGPPGDNTTSVNVRKAHRSFSPREGLVVGIEGIESILIAWKDDHTLIIYLPKSVAGQDFASRRLGPRHSEVEGVQIEYLLLP